MRPLPDLDSLSLRLFEEADAAELYARIAENRVRLSRWLPWAAAETLPDTAEFIRRTRRQLAADDGFQVAVLSDGAIVGATGFHAVSSLHHSTSIGYWLDREHEGRGLMTRAVAALVDHALSVWELNRVEIRAAPQNHRSRAIPERLGFVQEGVLRQSERVGGRYLDSVVYSMLAADWPPEPTRTTQTQS